MTAGFLITVENLSKTFCNSHGPIAAPVFEGVHFTLEEAEFVCLIGYSGCGKSTILNILAGLEEPTSGRVLMGGLPISDVRRTVPKVKEGLKYGALVPESGTNEKLASGAAAAPPA